MRRSLWWVLLVAVGFSVYVATQEDDSIEPLVRSGNSRDPAAKPDDRVTSAAPPARATTATGSLQRAGDPEVQEQFISDVNAWLQRVPNASAVPRVATAYFGAWASQSPPPPPPPPPYVAPPPPPPMAPSFPYSWVGRYIDTVQRAVVTSASQTWVLKAGDVIEGQWRIDTIEDRQMQLTYLPLQQKQMVGMK